MGERPGEIILISDGIETCDEDPCELVRSWAEKDIAIKVHVVGLGLDEKERTAMQCIARGGRHGLPGRQHRRRAGGRA